MVDFFNTILEMSVKGAVVALVVMLLRVILYKAPKKYSYLLWGVVGFRLVCPISFASVMSIFRIASPKAPTLPGVGGDIVVSRGNEFGISVDSDDFVSNGFASVEFAQKLDFIDIFNRIVMIIWVIGVIIALGYNFVSYFRLKARMEFAVRYKDNVFMSESVSSPFALGFFSPRIYLPYGLDDNTMEQIIAHEKCHIKRLDHIVKPLAFLILSIHWFNPICWLAFRLMSLDMEMSCDEKVLKIRGDEVMKKNYTRALLSFASNKRFPAPSPIAFSESSGNAKKRIKHALYWKKPKLAVNLICIFICVAVLVACAADAGDYKWKDVKTEVFGDVPYNIVYVSNGDGTCYVSEIRVDKDHNGNIHLVIPEKAPNGDTVTAIKNHWGLTSGETKVNLPTYLTFDSMKAIIKRIETADVKATTVGRFTYGSSTERDAKIFNAFYAERIGDDGTGYYELEPFMNLEEKNRLAYMLDFYGYDEEACYEDTVSFLNSLKVEDDVRNSFAREAFKYMYHYGSSITEITLPSTVKLIDYGSFDGCNNLKKVRGISDDCELFVYAEQLTTGLQADYTVVINGTPKEKLYSDVPDHDANEDFIKALD
ncbi:MAG: hypothetical protein IKK70_03260 [Clostridia bacterium]|nr:hypothetical protein [Clostridia bacterium]